MNKPIIVEVPDSVVDEITTVLAENVHLSNWAVGIASETLAAMDITEENDKTYTDKLNGIEWQAKIQAIIETLKYIV